MCCSGIDQCSSSITRGIDLNIDCKAQAVTSFGFNAGGRRDCSFKHVATDSSVCLLLRDVSCSV